MAGMVEQVLSIVNFVIRITVTRAKTPKPWSLAAIPISIASILTGAFTKKALATMASKTSKPEEPTRPSHPDFASRLAARRAELGNPELPRNSGKRRTASKRALLKAIEDAGGKW
jgi:hypothetical protein